MRLSIVHNWDGSIRSTAVIVGIYIDSRSVVRLRMRARRPALYARLLAVERSQIDPSSIIRSSLVLPILETLEALEQAMESVVLPLLVPSEEKQGQQ